MLKNLVDLIAHPSELKDAIRAERVRLAELRAKAALKNSLQAVRLVRKSRRQS